MIALRALFLTFAPLAFIWLPLLAVPLVYLLRRHSTLAAGCAALIVMLSGWLLWLQPPPEAIIFNRVLALSALGRALLIGLSLWLAFGFLLAARIPQGRSLFPFLLVSYALIALALAFEDFVLRVLVLKTAWLVTIILVQGGTTNSTRAASRLLVMTILALPTFLAAGEMLERHTLEPGLTWIEGPIAISLALGFSLMLAVIPFHAWLPQAAEDGPPLIAGFLVSGLGSAYLVLLVDLLGSYPWLVTNAQAQLLLSRGGLLLTFMGGALTLSETHLGRMWAYSTLANLGTLLVGLGLGTVGGMQAALLIGGARFLSLLLTAGALATIRHHATTLDMGRMGGVGLRLPLSMLVLAIGGLGLLGIPLTPGFPGLWAILQALSVNHPLWAWLLVGSNALGFLGYLRALATVFQEMPERATPVHTEPRLATTLLVGLAALGLFLAFFPQVLDPLVQYLLASLNLSRL